MKRGEWWRTLAVVVAAALVLGVVGQLWMLRVERAYTPHNLVRLHVVANSDQPEDVALKGRVRDVVVSALAPALAGVGEAREAAKVISGSLGRLQELVTQEVRRAGQDYPVRLALGRFPFPQRTYGVLTLPAGRYEALRVVLGQGSGSNWWCVLYPPLCLLELGVVTPAGGGAVPAMAPWDQPPQAGAPGGGAVEGGAEGVQVEVGFLCVEWLRGLRASLRGLGSDLGRWLVESRPKETVGGSGG